MGLFDFVQEAGKSINAQVDLAKEINELGVPVQDLDMKFADGIVHIYGKVSTQEEKEKVILALGNVKGVAQVDDNLEVMNPQPEAQFYTVKPGDSLSKIAKVFYGDAMKYPVIFEANTPMLSDPNKIYPGQVLRIPKL